jgi:hypothetical protein
MASRSFFLKQSCASALRAARYSALCALFLSMMACAVTDQTVKLPTLQLAHAAIAPSYKATVVVPLIMDLREATDHIGVRKNLFGMDTKIFPDRNVALWLRERLRAELRAAGVNVIRKHENESAAVVQLRLITLSSAPVFRWGHDDYETTLVVRLTVTSVGGGIIDREYVVTGVAGGQRPKEKNYTSSVEDATAALMRRLVPEIISISTAPKERKD